MHNTDFKCASKCAQTVKRLPMWETQVGSLGQKYTLEKEMATHSSILDWEIPWTWGPKELDTTEQLNDIIIKCRKCPSVPNFIGN